MPTGLLMKVYECFDQYCNELTGYQSLMCKLFNGYLGPVSQVPNKM